MLTYLHTTQGNVSTGSLIVNCVACLCVTVSQALKENSYPFLALIVLRDNRMTVVSRIEGPIGQHSLLTYTACSC